MLDRNSKIYVAGHTGLVGQAVVKELQSGGFTDIVTADHRSLDLMDGSRVEEFFFDQAPDYVVMCAGKVGGIAANRSQMADFCLENLLMNTNVIRACHTNQVSKLMVLGSSCIYPRGCDQPMKEVDILTGPLEPTNEGYALAKIAAIRMCRYFHEQYGHNFIAAIPCNVYGPGDNYDPQSSHVISAMIAKIHKGVACRAPSVTFWGTGSVRREFIYSPDLARRLVRMMDNYNAGDDELGYLNIGTGWDFTLREMAENVALALDYTGQIFWDMDESKDGMPRKLTSLKRSDAIFQVELPTPMSEAIRQCEKDFVSQQALALRQSQSQPT